MNAAPILDAYSARQHENVPFSRSNTLKDLDRYKCRMPMQKVALDRLGCTKRSGGWRGGRPYLTRRHYDCARQRGNVQENISGRISFLVCKRDIVLDTKESSKSMVIEKRTVSEQ